MKKYIKRVFQYNVPEDGEYERKLFWRVLEGLPIYIPIFIASFGFATIFLLCLGVLTNLAVLSLAVPFSLAVTVYCAVKLRLRTPGTVKERRIGSLGVALLVLVWFGLNLSFNSEDIYINRDPGSYNVTARWLMDHDNLVIYGSHVFGDDSSIGPDTAAYSQVPADHDNRLYAQAPHLFPVLIGLVGRVMGPEAMMKTNIAIGALALLAVYGFVRTLVRPRWALSSVFVLSLSLPMIYFSRDTYTEPLTMLLTFGALSSLIAVRRSKNYLLWGVAGGLAASGVLARIDAYLLLAGFLASIVILVLLQGERENIIAYSKRALAFLGGASAMGVLGWWDVSVLSKKYFIDLHSEFIAQMILITLILVGGPILVLVEAKRQYLSRFIQRYKKHISLVLLIGVGVFTLFLLSRPLWLTGHEAGNPYSRVYIASLQQKDGAIVDPYRNYSEYAIYWVMWYIGPVVGALGLVGFMIGVRSIFRKAAESLVPILLVFGAMGVLYLIIPRITPDQIWAIRRFLPIIMPAICLFAALGFQQLYSAIKPRLSKGRKYSVWSVAAILVLVPPIFITSPFYTHKEFRGQLEQINRLCALLPEKSAVLLVGSNGINMTQTVRTYCNVPAERMPEPTKHKISQAAQAAVHQGYRPILFVVGYEAGLVSSDLHNFTDTGALKYGEMSRELTHPPRHVDLFVRDILLGEIKTNGEIEPLSSR